MSCSAVTNAVLVWIPDGDGFLKMTFTWSGSNMLFFRVFYDMDDGGGFLTVLTRRIHGQGRHSELENYPFVSGQIWRARLITVCVGCEESPDVISNTVVIP